MASSSPSSPRSPSAPAAPAAAPAAAPKTLDERVAEAEAEVSEALLALYPKLLLIVFVALNLAVAFTFVSQSSVFAAGAAFMRAHMPAAHEGAPARRPLPGFAATLPEP